MVLRIIDEDRVAITCRKQNFTGYERDKETDLNLAQTRYQQASTGRFTTPDIYLIIFEMKRGRDASEQLEMLQKYLAEPRNLNRYIYALDNPYKYTDPTGMRPPTDIERAALGKLDELIRAAKVAEKQDLAAGLAKAKTEISDIIARLGKNEAAPRGVGIAVFAILNVGNGDYSNRASIRGSNGVVIGSGQFKCNVFVAEAYIQGGHIGDFPNANGGAYPLANILGDTNKETVGNLAIAWDLGGPAIGDIIAWKANDGPMGHSSIYIGGGVLAYAGGVPDGTPKVETMKFVDDSMRRPSQGWFGSQGPPEHQPGIIRRYNGKP